MILTNAPQHEAVLSNVGEIGEFRIRNSAKAFNILSSGLYANKIRAIIRELSCNAVDSHVGAGRGDIPFDVHLPTTLEPWFAIRDYGTGLSHDQVTSIYTTYFESTKTGSNDFIGALGLGSKSPFSYTDNFTVTAIKDGRKGIYSAFINGEGVPSIAQMMAEDTDEPTGVEVKFSVNDTYDFRKFQDEARQVYTYFKLRPNVTGVTDFQFRDVEYESMDIVPGVHNYKNRSQSMAIMGNIAYPIEVPQADKSLGNLRTMLTCGLEMHFAIGELDFQASREGLSYIPQTIAAIKTKLEAVNGALATVLAKEADAIDNQWHRALFLKKKKEEDLWSTAVVKYITDTNFPLANPSKDRWSLLVTPKITVKELAEKYNIVLNVFTHGGGSNTSSNVNARTEHMATPGGSGYTTVTQWPFEISNGARFVINDLTIGATERAKYHWKNTPRNKDNSGTHTVFVMSKSNKIKPMDTKAFFAAIHNPPEDWKILASNLKEKPRQNASLKNVTIMSLQQRGYGGYYREREMVWKDAGKADSFDSTKTFYYLPLSGFSVISKVGHSFDVKQFFNDLKNCGVPNLVGETIYGVRKTDIKFIEGQSNWINIEDHIAKILSTVDDKLLMSLVLAMVDNYDLCHYNNSIVYYVDNADSPYVKLVTQFKGFSKVKYSEQSLKNLCRLYAKNTVWDPSAAVAKFEAECKAMYERYPLFKYLSRAPNEEVAKYINLIDT